MYPASLLNSAAGDTESYKIVNSIHEFSEIRNEAINLVLQEREPQREIQEYILNTGPDDWKEWEESEIAIHRAETDKINDLNLPLCQPSTGRYALIKDIKYLAQLYFDITQESQLNLNLELVTSDMCQFFHTDKISYRLLCTYLGKGTEWLENKNARREGIGKGCNSKIVINENEIRQTSAFDIALLKGDSKESKQGVIHRSPKIEGTRQPWRLLLKLDSCKFGKAYW